MTTPTDIFTLPTAFGIKANPGAKMSWHKVDSHSWWDENSLDSRYNTWYENCPTTICWESGGVAAHRDRQLRQHRQILRVRRRKYPKPG
jgi:L,D-peptidoglycan transpeptidase YkuD (ErfK/YbiS/YcfS/YnhG family)